MSIVLLLLVPLGVVILVIMRSHLHKRHPLALPVISSSGTVDEPLNPTGSVLINGELWLARSADGLPIAVTARVTVIGIEDHLLLVTTI